MELNMKICLAFGAVLLAVTAAFSQNGNLSEERQPPLKLETKGDNATTNFESANELRWLMAVQNSDGSWGTPNNAMAATGLAALSYLSMGVTLGNSQEFSNSLAGALIFLMREYEKGCAVLQSLDEMGFAMATSAMCESYRVLWNPNIKPVAEKGLRAIIDRQEAFRKQPCDPDMTFSNNFAVTGWNNIALVMGARARLLADSKELRNALKEGAISFVAVSNLLSQITPEWVDQGTNGTDKRIRETCLSILQPKIMENLSSCLWVEERRSTAVPPTGEDDIEVDFGI